MWRSFLSYTTLPRILPRLQDLLSPGFNNVSYLMALIFESVRLLPGNHPYLRKENYGQFAVSQVIVQAYRNLKFNVRYIDQILIFFTIVLGIFLFMGQVLIVALSALAPMAYALPGLPPSAFDSVSMTLGQIVDTPAPEHDIAFMLLDKVFGIDDFFGSRVDPAGLGAGNFPYPYHSALHVMLETFSTALLVVALLVLSYFVATILAETVRDGTAFGKRFNRVWAPIRLVLAFGLLVPIVSGLNAGQYIVLTAAKWGSGFATNGLGFFYKDMHDAMGAGQTPYGPIENLIALPNPPDPAPLLQFMFVARACQYATQYRYYDRVGGTTLEPVRGWLLTKSGSAGPGSINIDSSGLSGFNQASDGTVPDVTTLATDTENDSLNILFGTKTNIMKNGHNQQKYPAKAGYVREHCGAISYRLAAPDIELAQVLQTKYLNIVSDMWEDDDLIDAAAALAWQEVPPATPSCNNSVYPHASTCGPGLATVPPIADIKFQLIKKYKQQFREAILEVMREPAFQTERENLEWCGPGSDPYYLKYGWAGAAICYNKIPVLNGAITSAATTLPEVIRYPNVMENVLKKRMKHVEDMPHESRFNPIVPIDSKPHDILEGKGEGRYVALAGNAAYTAWIKSGTIENILTGLGITDIINIIFGTEGVFNMLKPENQGVHPLALLSSAGRGLVESTVRNLGGGMIGSTIDVVFSTGGVGGVASSFLTTVAMITMVAGFVLFYVIPLMPFLYFFFAVGGWIKGIFEAMVGVPLWALAHLRIDGDGIPGNAAMNGYLLILEIFLRPILILFGLLASSLIFYAMIRLLNELWGLVVSNLTGFDAEQAAKAGFTDIEYWRGPIDEFFYTIIYAIIVYMTAMASFKLVDLIPNHILRWLGQSVEAFGETIGDPAQRMSQSATIGFSGVSRQAVDGAQSFTQAGNTALGANLRGGQGRQPGGTETK